MMIKIYDIEKITKGKTLEQRIAQLEDAVFDTHSILCPRCNLRTFGQLQPHVCSSCAFVKGDEI